MCSELIWDKRSEDGLSSLTMRRVICLIDHELPTTSDLIIQRSVRAGSGELAKYTVKTISCGARVEAEDTDCQGKAECAVSCGPEVMFTRNQYGCSYR